MKRNKFFLHACVRPFCGLLLVTALTACQTPRQKAHVAETPKTTATAPTVSASAPAIARPTLRIKAGSEQPLTDSKGALWAADNGFDGGSTTDRSGDQVTGTDQPELYRSERHSMKSYAAKVPNGSYLVKLYFAENYTGVTDDNGRVFTITVKDGDAATGQTIKEIKDFSPFKAAGGAHKAHVEEIHAAITSGQIAIVFTPQTQHPMINAIEITPE